MRRRMITACVLATWLILQGVYGSRTLGVTVDECPCNCDVNDSGQCNALDIAIVLDCVDGECSDCINSCDLDCDTDVDAFDVGIATCQVNAGPDGDPTCCDPDGACCVDGICAEVPQRACDQIDGTYVGDGTDCSCPDVEVTWEIPPDGVIDGRQPHPREEAAALQGICGQDEPIKVNGLPDSAENPCCWTIEDSDCYNPQRHPPYTPDLEHNQIDTLVCAGGTCTITCKRPITPGEETVITYIGDPGNPGRFTSLPCDVNGDRICDGGDSLAIVGGCVEPCMAQSCDPPWTEEECNCYSCDVDHSGEIGPPDILGVTDLRVGAGDFQTWDDAVVLFPPRLEPGVPDNGCGTRVRCLSFTTENACRHAMRVTFEQIPDSNCDGEHMWVAEPSPITESPGSSESTPPPTFWAATLQCEPLFTDWSIYGSVHVCHIYVVPNATYILQLVREGYAEFEDFYSDPLSIHTSMWGDVVGDTCTDSPDCVVDFNDISCEVDKFKSSPGAPKKSRADVAGPDNGAPDRIIDFVDIPAIVDAFRGLLYPYDSPPDELCP